MKWDLNDRLLFCCNNSERTYKGPLSALREAGAEVRTVERYRPDWIVIFGPAEKNTPGRLLGRNFAEAGAMVRIFEAPVGTYGKPARHRYKLVRRLDTFYFCVWRPELFWHSFRPIDVSTNPALGDVYILKKVEINGRQRQ